MRQIQSDSIAHTYIIHFPRLSPSPPPVSTPSSQNISEGYFVVIKRQYETAHDSSEASSGGCDCYGSLLVFSRVSEFFGSEFSQKFSTIAEISISIFQKFFNVSYLTFERPSRNVYLELFAFASSSIFFHVLSRRRSIGTVEGTILK